MKTKSTAERLPHQYDGATIFYHPLLYSVQLKLRKECTERGEFDGGLFLLRATQEAVDGWDEHVHDADDAPLAVPTGPAEQRRAKIAQIIDMAFPGDLIAQIGLLATADNPETARKNSPTIFGASSSSPTEPAASSLPVTTVAPSAPETA